jgi:hypothetical protein
MATKPDMLVTFPDGTTTVLSYNLYKKQGINAKTLDLIKHSHVYKWQLFREMEDALDDQDKLQLIAKKVEELEFYQQELWGFEKNASFHRWWEVPGCACGKMDAQDMYGTPYRNISMGCLVHFKSNKQS